MTKPKQEEQEQLNPDVPDSEGGPAKNAPPSEGDGELTPAQQAAFDARLKRALAKVEADKNTELEAEKERLRKEAAEKALLEKENFKELYEQSKAENESLKQQRLQAELNAKTDTLLDNAEITEPELRKFIKDLPADLELRAERISSLKSFIDAEAETRVAKRLHTNAPDKPGTTPSKKIADMTADEKVELRAKIGNDEFVKRVQRESSVSKG